MLIVALVLFLLAGGILLIHCFKEGFASLVNIGLTLYAFGAAAFIIDVLHAQGKF